MRLWQLKRKNLCLETELCSLCPVQKEGVTKYSIKHRPCVLGILINKRGILVRRNCVCLSKFWVPLTNIYLFPCHGVYIMEYTTKIKTVNTVGYSRNSLCRDVSWLSKSSFYLAVYRQFQFLKSFTITCNGYSIWTPRHDPYLTYSFWPV